NRDAAFWHHFPASRGSNVLHLAARFSCALVLGHMRQRELFLMGASLTCVVALVVACGSTDSTFSDQSDAANPFATDGSFGTGNNVDGGDLYANDPPPKWCGPAGQPSPPPPGGTVDCPDDKNKPGCACDNVGQTAPCWTGLRANRNLGVCKDG